LNLKPLKQFGQNYLQDKNTILKITNRFAPQKEDFILEIGPGQGALTEEISKITSNYLAVEIDSRVIENLQTQYPNVLFYNEDFLKFDFNKIQSDKKIRVIGNIPYNITAPILFKLIENHSKINDAILMVQLEVAERLSAKQRTKDYGILSVILNYFADVKLEFKISRNVFFPKPNVDSAIISIKFRDFHILSKDESIFIQFVKTAFSKRRKTLKNSLSNSIFESYFKNNIAFDFSKRAEELSTEEFVNLSNIYTANLWQKKEQQQNM